VDDLFIFNKEIKEIEIMKKLSQEFEMKDLRQLTYFFKI
jgi:hypothetical protein